MRDHRRGGEVEPERDIRAPRAPLTIRHVPPHRQREDSHAAHEQERVERILGGRDGSDGQRHYDCDHRSRPRRDGDRHHEAPPVQPRRPRRDQSDTRAEGGVGLIGKVRLQFDQHADQGRRDATDEGEQQQDARQRHAPRPREIFGERPSGNRDQRPGQRRGDRLADPRHCDEHQRHSDRYKDVVEAR